MDLLFQKTVLVLSVFTLSESIYCQQLAFPGADGFGKYASGGRGGKVIEVTNLNDDGPGSLRAAIQKNGKRTIVFKVSGTIFLESELKVNKGYLTIAGQTAPGDGITIADYPLKVSAENVIIRFIRCRLGDLHKIEDDALSVTDSKNIIIDHCSFSWSVDEVASCYKNRLTTMQWCIIAESMAKSVHHKGEHGYGGIWGGDSATFHHNLLAHNSSRNPRFNGARYFANWNEQVDFRNNIIYNWGMNSSYGGDPSDKDGAKAKINMVNNYYKPGPATKNNEIRYRILEPFPMKNYGYSMWYIQGNFMEGNEEVTNDNWNLGVQNISEKDKEKIRSNMPFGFRIDSTDSAIRAFELVLQHAGCNRPNIDSVDIRILNDVRTGKARFGGSWGKNSGIIDSQKDVGGWPLLQSTQPPVDSDHDGMSDEWENNHGLDPLNVTDGTGDIDGNGFTNLEDYINSLI